MNWRRAGNWWWESACGYRVSAARVRPQGLRYCAWAPPVEPNADGLFAPRALLGCYDYPEAARQACDNHATRVAA